MSQIFDQVTLERIGDFIAERGLKTGVPADVAYYIIDQVPAGEARIRDESWDDQSRWIFRAPLEVEGQEPVVVWMVKTENKAPEAWENDEFNMVGTRWTVEVLPPEENINHVQKTQPTVDLATGTESHSATFTPANDKGSEINDQSFGQAIDAVLEALPGTLAIRCEEWDNATAWVVLEEAKMGEDKMLMLTVNYSNGIKMPWTPTLLDMRSKSWTSKSPLE